MTERVQADLRLGRLHRLGREGAEGRVSGWRAGDVVEVEGALRRRFQRGGAGTSTRLEVEVLSGRLVSAPSADRAAARAAGCGGLLGSRRVRRGETADGMTATAGPMTPRPAAVPSGRATEPLWSAYDVAMLDLDGVVYIGPDAVPGRRRAPRGRGRGGDAAGLRHQQRLADAAHGRRRTCASSAIAGRRRRRRDLGPGGRPAGRGRGRRRGARCS